MIKLIAEEQKEKKNGGISQSRSLTNNRQNKRNKTKKASRQFEITNKQKKKNEREIVA